MTTVVSAPPQSDKTLTLNYSGRVIDHLGLQMYQSPVAAVAEMVANAWDAEADRVTIRLPDALSDSAEIVVRDDGVGMTFVDCQKRFLNVGFARRGNNNRERSPIKNRRVLGRKGIGKFAGFGIARVIQIDTVSGATGERTIFEMDIEKLRADVYITTTGTPIDVLDYQEPYPGRWPEQGTTVRLRHLLLSRSLNAESFARSMARRFLLHQTAADFRILVNDNPLPDSDDLQRVQFSFPTHYRDEECPDSLVIDDDWGIEDIGSQQVRWRVRFHSGPINDEELRGISVFANGKLVQTPFFFNVSGGLSGQHGQQYLSGQVQADFLDEQDEDLIAPERQRVSWEHELGREIESWGKARLRQLLRIWRDRRVEEREHQLVERLVGFESRLSKLQNHERRTVTQAIRRLAQIETLSQGQFEDLGRAIITAWEQGRLHELVVEIADVEDLSPGQLIDILAEAQVLTALNTAEAIRTKLQTVGGLKQRIERKELENAVRDYISEHPWLVSPQWDTFAVESGLKALLDQALHESGINTDPDFSGRVDLALSSGEHLLILEFMRPSLTLDWDHVNRFERYVTIVRNRLTTNTGSRFKRITGYVVADKLHKRSDLSDKVATMKNSDMFALDWQLLFSNAVAQWRDFLTILATQAPDDERLQALAEYDADLLQIVESNRQPSVEAE